MIWFTFVPQVMAKVTTRTIKSALMNMYAPYGKKAFVLDIFRGKYSSIT